MNDQTRNEVLRRWYAGQSMRRIARDLHASIKSTAIYLHFTNPIRDNTPPWCPPRIVGRLHVKALPSANTVIDATRTTMAK